MTDNWRRPLAVVIAAALTTLLHGLLLIWYLNRPAPPAFTQAMALPMIDIALAAPNVGAPVKAFAPPLPPKPVIKPPEKKTRPKVKPKPKPKPKAKSEIKKPVVKPENKPAESVQPTTSASQPTSIAPVATAPTANNIQSSPMARDVPANANANYLNNPKPDYPHLARQRHWEGKVILRVYVTADGRCGNLSVYRSSGHEALDESAMTAV
ncbi:MAG: TonB family protein, partial [Methylovulum sp.]|nr:TonB family protein [Methylovulum sp.]